MPSRLSLLPSTVDSGTDAPVKTAEHPLLTQPRERRGERLATRGAAPAGARIPMIQPSRASVMSMSDQDASVQRRSRAEYVAVMQNLPASGAPLSYGVSLKEIEVAPGSDPPHACNPRPASAGNHARRLDASYPWEARFLEEVDYR